MIKSIIAFASAFAVMFSVVALAQEAPLRGVGLLALNANDAHAATIGRQSQFETPDGGGGSLPRTGRGSGDGGPARRSVDADAPSRTLPDALPPVETIPRADPSAPAATTPKRPSYRWQSLVPGAIK